MRQPPGLRRKNIAPDWLEETGIVPQLSPHIIRAIAVSLFMTVAASPTGSIAADQRLNVSLEVEVQQRDGRDIPVFTVSVRNIGNSPLSVVDVRADTFLERMEAPILIVALDPSVGIGGSQSDDFHDPWNYLIELAPGEGFDFVADPNVPYSDLIPGRYRAKVHNFSVNTYGGQGAEGSFDSNVVEFEIINTPSPRPANSVDPPNIEKWSVFCDPVMYRCEAYYMAKAPLAVLPTDIKLAVGLNMDTKAVRITALQAVNCIDESVLLQVGDNEPIPMRQPRGMSHVFLTGEAAQNAINQILVGETLTMEVHLTPDCIKHNVSIPLQEFAAAWREFLVSMDSLNRQ